MTRAFRILMSALPAFVLTDHVSAAELVTVIECPDPQVMGGFGQSLAVRGHQLLVGEPAADDRMGRVHV